uniref:AtC3H23-like CCCH zinc finger domain-containing protein n=1 Tax=Ananas comosus var. bracteatus TaxID=296719 RepID=A0A6V7NN18_ANACO|nr:unnamed protein product [Ananas comosus var. bracteatus]
MRWTSLSSGPQGQTGLVDRAHPVLPSARNTAPFLPSARNTAPLAPSTRTSTTSNPPSSASSSTTPLASENPAPPPPPPPSISPQPPRKEKEREREREREFAVVARDPSSLPDIKNSVYATDEFRMYSFKVRPCSPAYSHDWTECPFVHPGENAWRRDPRKYHYSYMPCLDFRKGACRCGDMCEGGSPRLHLRRASTPRPCPRLRATRRLCLPPPFGTPLLAFTSCALDHTRSLPAFLASDLTEATP